MNIRRVFILVILSLYTFSLVQVFWGETTEEYFSRFMDEELFSILKEEGELSRAFSAENPPLFMPGIETKEKYMSEILKQKPTVGTEMIIYTELPYRKKSLSLLDVYNTMNAVSTLKGIQFYDPRLDTTFVFFLETYPVDSLGQKKQDPFYIETAPKTELDLYIQDPFIGKNIYHVNYETDPYSVAVSMENRTPIALLFIPIVNEGHIKALYIILPHDNTLIFYGFNWLKVQAFQPLARKKNGELRERIRAIYLWMLHHLPN